MMANRYKDIALTPFLSIFRHNESFLYIYSRIMHSRCPGVVSGCESGGRWPESCQNFRERSHAGCSEAGAVRSSSVGTTDTMPWARHHSSVSRASGSSLWKLPVSQ